MTQFSSSINNPFQLNSAIPEIMSSVMPDYSAGVGKGGSFTADYSGYMRVNLPASNSHTTFSIGGSGFQLDNQGTSNHNNEIYMYPVGKGVTVSFSVMTNVSIIFYPCKGAI